MEWSPVLKKEINHRTKTQPFTGCDNVWLEARGYGVYSCFEKGCRKKVHATIPKGIVGSFKFGIVACAFLPTFLETAVCRVQIPLQLHKSC